MNFRCKYCNSLNFKEEVTNGYKNCCNNGQNLIHNWDDYPVLLKDLFINRSNTYYENFYKHIRSYNSAVAFASFGATYDKLRGNGPKVIRIQGQIYHQTSNLYRNDEGITPKYAQLYVYDASEAARIQMGSKGNEKCNEDLMKILNTFMRENNPFAESLKMLNDVYKEELQRIGSDSIVKSNFSLIIKADRTMDMRRYNIPKSNEVAFIFDSINGDPPTSRDIQIHPKSNNQYPLKKIDILNPNLDPMVYPIIYPFGEQGWYPNKMVHNYLNEDLKKISMLKWKTSQLAITDNFNPLLHCGTLLQQWIIDSYINIESNNLNYFRLNQKKLKIESYKGLMDHLNNIENERDITIGKRTILPSNFMGSSRNQRERYMDAMSLIAKFGRPDLFITFTCNSNWKEITENLNGSPATCDRPDLICRVFKLKLKEFFKDVLHKKIYGNVIGYTYTIEFQKRGLPHAHILIILDAESKIYDANKVDSIISAEIPNQIEEPELFNIVTKCMIHGPCGPLNPKSSCMIEGKCSKSFPKEYNNVTKIFNDSYPHYRRREGTQIMINKNTIDNRWIVPYNPYTLKKYNAHINVEICSSVKSVKYIIKYIHKGYDCSTISLKNAAEYDEITSYIDSRYISACEATWRLLQFKMYKASHSIVKLALHIEDQQTIVFEEGEERIVLNNELLKETTLTAWLKLNRYDENARLLKYTEIPTYYTYEKKNRKWKRRKYESNSVIARVYSASPKDNQRFYLRILLLHVTGCKSFEDIRTVNGIIYRTYQEAAVAMNLVEDDKEFIVCMKEASDVMPPNQIRKVFAYILCYNSVNNSYELWELFKDKMSEDYIHKGFDSKSSENKALLDIEQILIINNYTLQLFNLPETYENEELEEEEYDTEEEKMYFNEHIDTLNEKQKHIFNEITQIISDINILNKCFYIDGPGGSGKTYLYNVLMAFYRSQNEIVLPFATTGISALLLKGGRTAHSGFKLPIPMFDHSLSSMNMNSVNAKTIRKSKLIIIDESSMLLSNSLRCINILLQDIMKNDLLFGGKAILFGGDFRQTLPVITHGQRTTIIENCIFSNPLWDSIKKYTLIENMRVSDDRRHEEWLLKIGNGSLTSDFVEIPEQMVSTDIVKDIFGESINMDDVEEISNKAILAVTNSDAAVINNKILSVMSGEIKYYYSIDKAESDFEDVSMMYPDEFLNSLNPSGLPPSVLKLKKNSVVMLIRNLNYKDGLCNGTRLIVKTMNNRSIEAEILTGEKKGNRVYIPKITLTPSDTTYPFKFSRYQLPLISAFSITINKSQGQTFNKIGIYLNTPVFAHGQLYTAFSRCRSKENIKVFIKDSNIQGKSANTGKTNAFNVVYKEIFNRIMH